MLHLQSGSQLLNPGFYYQRATTSRPNFGWGRLWANSTEVAALNARGIQVYGRSITDVNACRQPSRSVLVLCEAALWRRNFCELSINRTPCHPTISAAERLQRETAARRHGDR